MLGWILTSGWGKPLCSAPAGWLWVRIRQGGSLGTRWGAWLCFGSGKKSGGREGWREVLLVL